MRYADENLDIAAVHRWQESDSIRDRYTGKHIAEEKEELYYMERKFTSENFEAEVLKSEKPVLVDFYADWCGPCKMMAPAVEELANEQDDVIVGKLNVDFAPELARTYKVFSIPTLILFKNGEAVEKRVGVQSKAELEMLIK
ncbi:thioredoxin [Clostridium sp. OF09-36]|uniref:thioredoxin n=1 Tax=Clostridium sp. OF09-36 TaxID=2292310 RepID=UPI00325A5367